MLDAAQVVRSYLSAWSENDPERRRELLERCWHDGGTIEIGTRRFVGRVDVENEIARYRNLSPSDRAELTSDVDCVGNWVRFTARAARPDGSTYSDVLDIGELADDGRIRRILSFRLPDVPRPA